MSGSRYLLALTAENLAEALLAVTSNEDILRTSEDLGRKIRHEDGIAEAVSFIESHPA